jgi:hypothetical protein
MTMRRSRAISLVTGLALAAAGLAASGRGSGDQLVPADQARSLDSTLQQVADATRAGECRKALSELAAAQRIYADLPDTLDERLAARIKQGLDQLARTVPTQCAAVPETPTRPTTTGTDTTTNRTEPTTTTTTTSTTEPTTTTTTPTTSTPTTQTGTGTTPNGGIAPEATGTGTTP